MNLKEELELLIEEGIDFLDSTVGRLRASDKIQLKDFEQYIRRFTPVIVKEKLDYFCNSEKTKIQAGKIIEQFNNIANYFKEQYSKYINSKMITGQEFQIVCVQYINMLTNNLGLGDLRESFIGWCENGDVFYTNKYLSEHSQGICCLVMKQLEEKLDSFTNRLADIHEELCKNKSLSYEELYKLKENLNKNIKGKDFWKYLILEQIIDNLEQKDNCVYNIKETDIENIVDKVTNNERIWQTLGEVISGDLREYETENEEEEEEADER